MKKLQNLKTRVSITPGLTLKSILQQDGELTEEDIENIDELQERIDDSELELEYNQRRIEKMKKSMTDHAELNEGENIFFKLI